MATNPFDTAVEVRRLARAVTREVAEPDDWDNASIVLGRYADLIERVEQLPSPIRRSTDLDGGNPLWRCQWCETTGTATQPHKQNGCLALMLRPAAPTDAT